MFIEKFHYTWPFSIAMFVYQRVILNMLFAIKRDGTSELLLSIFPRKKMKTEGTIWSYESLDWFRGKLTGNIRNPNI